MRDVPNPTFDFFFKKVHYNKQEVVLFLLCFLILKHTRRVNMAKKTSVEEVQEIVLEFGFVRLKKPQKKWLDIRSLSETLIVMERGLCLAWGSTKYDRLLQFCEKCINEGNVDMIVTVVAKGGDKGESFQALFECNGALETFILKDSFFKNFGSPPKKAKTKVKTQPMETRAQA